MKKRTRKHKPRPVKVDWANDIRSLVCAIVIIYILVLTTIYFIP